MQKNMQLYLQRRKKSLSSYLDCFVCHVMKPPLFFYNVDFGVAWQILAKFEMLNLWVARAEWD